MANFDHLDVEALTELREVMDDEFSVLIETYLKDSIMRISSIHKALEHNDADALHKAAHSFKGSCGNIGAPQLADLCRQMEESGRDGDLSNTGALLEQMTAEFEEVKSLLSKL